MVKNKQCLACHTKFSYCPNCSKVDALKPSWASQFCSESCTTLWTTLTKFGMSMLTKSEAKEIISSLDLKPIDVYVTCIQRDYAKVMAEDKKPKRGKRIAINPIDDAVNIEPTIIEDAIHEVVFQENE